MIGIIPAAGKGVRFKELGKNYSKTILPYKEKPILIHQIEWMIEHGCDDIRVVVNHNQSSIVDILEIYDYTDKVKLIHQRNQDGLSGAILCALSQKDQSNVLILLGDLVVSNKMSHDEFLNNFISIKKVDDYSRWCMVKSDVDSLKFYDKPSIRPDTSFAVSGLYHFNDSQAVYSAVNDQILDGTKLSGEYQFSTAIEKINEKNIILLKEVDLIDFGTLEEYLDNRSVKISRSFNDLSIEKYFITKSSELEREKIIREYNWFNNLPDEIKIHTPRIFRCEMFSKRTWYKMEKVLASSLREIYLFLDSSEETWSDIFNAMFGIIDSMEKFGQDNLFMRDVINKTKSRVSEINIPVENILINKFIIELETLSAQFIRPSLMHGDFCFSNLLYHFESKKIIMIDPRGELFGDHYYDIAKICHSVLYDYDFVDSELYIKQGESFKLYNSGKDSIKKLFIEILESRYTEEEIRYIRLLTASLFLSMIPLHTHNVNNQKIYYNTFKNIYAEYYTNANI